MAFKNPNAFVAVAERTEEVTYQECLRNFSRENGGFVFDGCGLFTRQGDGPNEALFCVACGCHRNNHRNVEVPPSAAQLVAMQMRNDQIRRALATPPAPVVIDNGDDAPQPSTDA